MHKTKRSPVMAKVSRTVLVCWWKNNSLPCHHDRIPIQFHHYPLLQIRPVQHSRLSGFIREYNTIKLGARKLPSKTRMFQETHLCLSNSMGFHTFYDFFNPILECQHIQYNSSNHINHTNQPLWWPHRHSNTPWRIQAFHFNKGILCSKREWHKKEFGVTQNNVKLGNKWMTQEKEFSTTQNNLNFATNIMTVTETLVATASYVGPLQSHMHHDVNQIQYENVWVNIFTVCDTLSFYFAIVAIRVSLIPLSQCLNKPWSRQSGYQGDCNYNNYKLQWQNVTHNQNTRPCIFILDLICSITHTRLRCPYIWNSRYQCPHNSNVLLTNLNYAVLRWTHLVDHTTKKSLRNLSVLAFTSSAKSRPASTTTQRTCICFPGNRSYV